MAFNPLFAAAVPEDLPRMVSCRNVNGQSWLANRSWPRNARQTVVSRLRPLIGQRRARLQQPLPLQQHQKNPLAESPPDPSRKRGSTPSGRSPMEPLWTFPYPRPRVANFPWNIVRRSSSRHLPSRSASHLAHRLLTTRLNQHTRQKIWPSRPTTTRCSFSMRLPRLGRR